MSRTTAAHLPSDADLLGTDGPLNRDNLPHTESFRDTPPIAYSPGIFQLRDLCREPHPDAPEELYGQGMTATLYFQEGPLLYYAEPGLNKYPPQIAVVAGMHDTVDRLHQALIEVDALRFGMLTAIRSLIDRQQSYELLMRYAALGADTAESLGVQALDAHKSLSTFCDEVIEHAQKYLIFWANAAPASSQDKPPKQKILFFPLLYADPKCRALGWKMLAEIADPQGAVLLNDWLEHGNHPDPVQHVEAVQSAVEVFENTPIYSAAMAGHPVGDGNLLELLGPERRTQVYERYLGIHDPWLEAGSSSAFESPRGAGSTVLHNSFAFGRDCGLQSAKHEVLNNPKPIRIGSELMRYESARGMLAETINTFPVFRSEAPASNAQWRMRMIEIEEIEEEEAPLTSKGDIASGSSG